MDPRSPVCERWWRNAGAQTASVMRQLPWHRGLPGDDFTDTRVEVLAGATTLGGPSADGGYHENYLSAAITAAGPISTKIYASPDYDPTQTHYDALIYLE